MTAPGDALATQHPIAHVLTVLAIASAAATIYRDFLPGGAPVLA